MGRTAKRRSTHDPAAADSTRARSAEDLPFTRYPKPKFLDEGTYRISGSGGADVGEFAVEARLGKPIRWRGGSELDVIDRSRGVVVRWGGATKRDRVAIMAINVEPLSGAMGLCLCVAAGEAGRLQIPPLALANLPPSAAIPGIPMNYIFMGVLPAGAPQRFQARGVERGVALVTTLLGRTVSFQ